MRASCFLPERSRVHLAFFLEPKRKLYLCDEQTLYRTGFIEIAYRRGFGPSQTVPGWSTAVVVMHQQYPHRWKGQNTARPAPVSEWARRTNKNS
jgi:hypothetical protein